MMVQRVLWPGSVTRWCLIHRLRRAKKYVFVSSWLTVLRLTSGHRIQAGRFPWSTTTWQAPKTFFTGLWCLVGGIAGFLVPVTARPCRPAVPQSWGRRSAPALSGSLPPPPQSLSLVSDCHGHPTRLPRPSEASSVIINSSGWVK